MNKYIAAIGYSETGLAIGLGQSETEATSAAEKAYFDLFGVEPGASAPVVVRYLKSGNRCTMDVTSRKAPVEAPAANLEPALAAE